MESAWQSVVTLVLFAQEDDDGGGGGGGEAKDDDDEEEVEIEEILVNRAQYFDIFSLILGDRMCSLPMAIFGIFAVEKKGKVRLRSCLMSSAGVGVTSGRITHAVQQVSLNQVFTGLALLCSGDLRDRVNLCFSLYDGSFRGGVGAPVGVTTLICARAADGNGQIDEVCVASGAAACLV